jgi:hypothetical protein
MANRRVDREKDWRGIIREWSRSDLSQRRFCERRKIIYPTFCYWRRRIAEIDGCRGAPKKPEESTAHPFVQVEVKPSDRVGSTCFYEVTLESGHLIRVPFQFEPDSLDRLIQILEGHRC